VSIGPVETGRRTDVDWFEDERFWVDFSGILVSPGRLAEAAERVATSPLLAVPNGAAVLDLGCGTGTYAIPFAQRGANVTGVDLSAAMLDRARTAARGAGIDLRLVQADMREFLEPGAFDLIVSMYTSFGYFADQDENRRVLSNALASLEPGGHLVVDMVGKEVLAASGIPPRVTEVDGGTLFRRGTILDDWSRFRNDFTLVQGGRARHGSIVHHLYSAVELKAMLADAGFGAVECFGSFDGAPYDSDAQRLIVRATRTP
jgi:SAM-dependent methyltransferase